MVSSLNKPSADSKFTILNSALSLNIDQVVLTNLYQPIIGVHAVELYNLFWSMSLKDHNQMSLHKLYEVQSLMDISIDYFVQIRRKLEGLNLISTKVSSQKADLFIEVLHLPLTADQFFNTDILATLLLNKVGDQIYSQIVNRLISPLPEIENLKDVSASFLDEFKVSKELIDQRSKAVTESKKLASDLAKKPLKIPESSNDFDFKLLLNILDSSFVDEASVKAAFNVVISEHLIYGINELEMADFIKKATDLSTDQLNPNRLKNIILKSYGTISNQAGTRSLKKNDSSKNDPLQDFSPATKQLISIAKKTAPAIFLQQIKKQKHGFATSGEQRILDELVSKGIFPNDVLNILVYHLLIDEDNSTIKKNLADTIANDWAQKGVSDATSAIKVIQARKDGKKLKQIKTSVHHYNRNSINESLPDWAKQPQNSSNDSNNELTDKQKARLKEQLNKLKKQE